MIGKYKVVHLIGSTKGNYELFKNAEEYFTKMGYIVFKPVFYNLDSKNGIIDMLNDMCYEKLLFSDIICIVTPEHIGESTRNRIRQSYELNKKIIVFDGTDVKDYVQN